MGWLLVPTRPGVPTPPLPAPPPLPLPLPLLPLLLLRRAPFPFPLPFFALVTLRLPLPGVGAGVAAATGRGGTSGCGVVVADADAHDMGDCAVVGVRPAGFRPFDTLALPDATLAGRPAGDAVVLLGDSNRPGDAPPRRRLWQAARVWGGGG